MLKTAWKALRVMPLLLIGVAGCVQRTLTVRSDPPGALVYMNDQEIGRTPVTRNIIWYGTYDVELRMPGYASVKTTAPVIAPWWQWVPLDLLAEALPLEDHHDLHYTLRPPNDQEIEADLLVRRGEDLREQLQSSQRPPTTGPARAQRHKKKPETRPAT